MAQPLTSNTKSYTRSSKCWSIIKKPVASVTNKCAFNLNTVELGIKWARIAHSV